MSISIKLYTPATAVFIAMCAVAVPAFASDGHNQSHSHGAADHSGHAMTGSMEMDADMVMSDTVTGSIVELDQNSRKILLDHEAMPNIGMDAMKMSFSVADDVNLKTLKVGQRVSFTAEMVAGVGFQVTAIHSVE